MPKIVNCQVCYQTLFKYKCPKCMLRYCSVVCYKQHKDEACGRPDPATQNTATSSSNATHNSITNSQYEFNEAINSTTISNSIHARSEDSLNVDDISRNSQMNGDDTANTLTPFASSQTLEKSAHSINGDQPPDSIYLPPPFHPQIPNPHTLIVPQAPTIVPHDSDRLHRSANSLADDAVSPEALSRLSESAELKAMLKDGDLRQMLRVLDETGDADLTSRMKIPIFADFASECLKIVEQGRF